MKRTALKMFVLGDLDATELAELILDTAKRVLPKSLQKSKRVFAAEMFREVADRLEELP